MNNMEIGQTFADSAYVGMLMKEFEMNSFLTSSKPLGDFGIQYRKIL